MLLIPLIFGSLVLLIIVGGILGFKAQRKRNAALQTWAHSRGLTFLPDKIRDVEHRFPDFECFRQGKNRYAQRFMHGQIDGRTVYAFDYHYQTQTTRHSTSGGRHRTATRRKQTHHHQFSALIIEPGFTLEPLLIRPEGWTDRVASLFGRGDIQFQSAEFNRKFHVSAPNPDFAHQVLHARTIDRLLEAPPHTIEFAPHQILLIRKRRRFDPAEFEAALALISTILNNLPRHLKR